MRRWLALGVVVVGIAWGPYLYSELTQRPRRQSEAAEALQLTAASEAAREQESQLSAATNRAPAPEAGTRIARGAGPAAAGVIKPTAAAAPSRAPEREPEAPPPPSAAALPAAYSGEALPQRFRRVFDDETRDAFWAVDQEPRLRSLVEGVGVEPTGVGEVACRKTVCRVAFTAALEGELESKVSAKLREEFSELALDAQHQAEAEPHTTLYVLRSGYVLDPVPLPSTSARAAR